MIQVNELRIGNLITDGTLQVLKVRLVEPGSCKVMGRVSNHFGDRIEGIPLTPEILEKAGAKEDDYTNYVLNVGALKMKFRHNTQWYSEIGGIYFGSRIQHVHELQNIYHAFMGRELEINLNEATEEG